MSIIFGIKRESDEPVAEAELLPLARSATNWATGVTKLRAAGSLGMGFLPKNSCSHSELRPVVDAVGNVVCLDGRLDNREDLIRRLGISSAQISDEQIILASFEKWKCDSFSMFVGDWAMALWDHDAKSLFLARDHSGSRTLYYHRRHNEIRWASYLEPLIFSSFPHSLDRGFVSIYLSGAPIYEATPYVGVWAVPAGHYLSFFHGKLVSRRHWLPPEIGEIRYKEDQEYEAQFFHLFEGSVRRRLEPRQGLVAQLSGGMDSTSIVCMADHICGMNAPKTDLIDTVSFYDASESGWDDDRYFPLVEAFRGKRGIHIPASGASFSLEPPPAGYVLPGTNGSSEDLELYFIAAFGDKPCSTVLSGLGGDEFMGGIPDPTPELAAKLVRGEIKQLMSASVSWGLARRLPFVDLLVDLGSFFRNSRSNQSRWVQKAPPWLIRERRKHVRNIPLREDFRRLSTLQAYAVKLLESVHETLPHQTPGLRFRPEYRYPILDRDLLEFLIGIPREQVVAPGERRSLMRRSLRTLLPPAILARRRKAAISQGPLRAMIAHRDEIARVFQGSWLASLGFVKGDVFQICLDRVASGQDLFLMPGLKRAIDIELWLQTRISAGDLQI